MIKSNFYTNYHCTGVVRNGKICRNTTTEPAVYAVANKASFSNCVTVLNEIYKHQDCYLELNHRMA